VKLGGSVLTDKSRYRTPRLDAIARLASELARTPAPLVIVHGAGSYGHVVAKTHGLAEGKGTALDAARVHADVRELTALVLAALREAGVPAASHSTFDLARLDKGALLSFHAPAIAESLRSGFVPVLSGDVALDASRKWGILSGDVLMVEIARAFAPERAVFATDVDGIYDAHPGGKLLARIGPDDTPFAGGAAGHDVTGGMAGKLSRARDVAAAMRRGRGPQDASSARFAGEVRVVNGGVPGRVADALAGKANVGTTVLG
jgi:isopentenyl phosphate kinase